MIKITLERECGYCGKRRPLDVLKCPTCVTLRQGVVAVCTCGTRMDRDGQDFKRRYLLFLCPSCKSRGRLKR